jgi:hypothetical protein
MDQSDSEYTPGFREQTQSRSVCGPKGCSREAMGMRKHLASILLTVALLFGGQAQAQENAPVAATEKNQPVFKPEELEQMLAPIALYPDALLAQILMASTYPLEVVQADRWVKQPEHKDLKGDPLVQALDKETWDPSVKSLVPFPQVLHTMSEKLDWTQRVGDAVLAQRKDVLDAVQTLRKRAEAAGTLATTEQQQVVVQENAVAIEPADPEKVYVPVYNPSVAYGSWPYPAYPPPYYPPPPAYAPVGSAFMSGIGFASGVAVVGSIWGWSDCDWNNDDINVNYNNYNSINRTNIESGRATRLASSGGAASWQFQPTHRGGVAYRDAASRATYQRPTARSVQERQRYRGYADVQRRAERPAGATARGQRLDRRSVDRQPALARRSPAAFSSMPSGRAVAAQSARGQSSRQASVNRSAPSSGARAAPQRAGGGGGGRRR